MAGLRPGRLRNALTIAVLTFFVTIALGGPAQGSLQHVRLEVATAIILAIILFAVVCDVISVAATAAKEAPFHAMASHRVPGAKEAVYLVRNADRVNSLFSDVIGDVAGTVNGALGAAVVFQLNELLPQIPLYALSLLVLGVIASLTVGSKAWTKPLAVQNATSIIAKVGFLVHAARRFLRLQP